MVVKLFKDNEPIIESLAQEQQMSLTSIDLSYEELGNMYIMAMVLGHGVDTLIIELAETDYVDSILSLFLSAKEVIIKNVETCNSSFEILSKLYPEKKAKLRRAKMLGQDLWEVVRNE